ncbi:uncharacterized protein [Antennarius striatus]|uniref:uncharacterized protein isoform X2 n=1 Tax=Antennarius striatus TaxID=241820 RepID=UPI0035AE2E73
MLNRWSFHIMMQTKEGSGRGGGDKTAMDLRTVMIISTLLLKTTESVETTFRPDVSETYAHVQTNNNRTGSNTPTSVSAKATPPRSLVLELGLLTVVWTSECEGDVKLILHHLVSSPLPVCHGSVANVQSLLRLVCQSKKGCTGTPQWDKSRNKLNGYWFSESGAVGTNCETLRVQCTGEELTDVQGQLQAHKVVTALLCCVLFVLLLIRFTRPTIKALQKRLSDRRQNRWIGPTESHSALEGLITGHSREPSSNRNSGHSVWQALPSSSSTV